MAGDIFLPQSLQGGSTPRNGGYHIGKQPRAAPAPGQQSRKREAWMPVSPLESVTGQNKPRILFSHLNIHEIY